VVKRKNPIIATAGKLDPGRPARSLITILTELPQDGRELKYRHMEMSHFMMYAPIDHGKMRTKLTGGSCSTHAVREKCIQNFGRQACREETARKT
jgi:hypothetical protein